MLELLGSGHVALIEQGGAPSDPILQGLVLRALACAAPGSLELWFIDPSGGGRLAAPFAPVLSAGGRPAATAVAIDERAIEDMLREIRQRVLEVQSNVLQGRHASLSDLYAVTGRATVPRRLLVVNGYPNGFNREAARALDGLLRSGAPGGAHVVLTVDPSAREPDDVPTTSLLARSTVLQPQGGGSFAAPSLPGFTVALDRPPAEGLIERAVGELARALQAAASAAIPLGPTLPSSGDLWAERADHKLETIFGYDDRGNAVTWEVTDESPLWSTFIAGTAGAGKSNLIHTLIAGLAARYPPEELEMYLLDFKQGVELWQYGPGGGADWLPHVKVVARATDREFGVDVLDRLAAKVKERYSDYGRVGLRRNTYSEYRDKGHPMPRTLVVLDEFQNLLLPADRTGDAALAKLTEIARLGRAAGLHLVLATQTLNGLYEIMNQLNAVLDQHEVRIALKLDPDMSDVVLKGHREAASLTKRGEAIYQRGAGVPVLTRVDVLFAEPATLDEVRGRCAKRRPPNARPPIHFDGDTRPAFDELGVADAAIGPPVVGETALTIVLGRAVAMAPPVSVELRPEPGNHLVIGGGGREEALGVMQSAALGIAAQAPPGGVQFLLVDPVPGHDGGATALKTGLSMLGANVLHLTRGPALVRQLQRLRSLPASGRPRQRYVVVGLDMDIFGVLGVDGSVLAELLELGPVRGVHGLMWFGSLTGVSDILGYGFLDRHLLRRVLLDVSRDELRSSDFLPVNVPERQAGTARADVWTRDEPMALRRFAPPIPLDGPALAAWLRGLGVARWRQPGSIG